MLNSFVKKYPNLCLLLGCLFASAICALYFGQNKFWDLRNYHIYTPFAFLTGRIGFDLFPAGVHSYFNPLADIPYYLSIKYFNNLPRLAAVIQSVWLGFSFFFIVKILRLALPKGVIAVESVLLCLLFFFSPGTHGWATSNTGDMMACAFILASLFITLKYCAVNLSSKKIWLFFLSGALLGIGFLLKYTNGPFILAYAFIILFCFRNLKDFFACAGVFSLGFIAAFTLVGGAWFWTLYSHFKSPLFPFYNNIFHSPYFENIALVDPRFFLKKDMWNLILLPFSSAYFSTMHILEISMRTLYFVLYLICFGWLIYKIFNKETKEFDKKIISLLLLFFTVGYAVWLKLFLHIRYVIPLEAAGALLAVTALAITFKGEKKYFYMALVCAITAFYTRGPAEVHQFDKQILAIETLENIDYESIRNPDFENLISVPFEKPSYPYTEDGAVVILAGHKLSFILPFMNPKSIFVGGIMQTPQAYSTLKGRVDATRAIAIDYTFYKHNLTAAILEKIQNAENLYVLISDYSSAVYFEEGLPNYGVKINKNKCSLIRTNMDYPIWLCRAEWV